jgi:membrane-bound metal-dependent hydrolase YbcI (DUF457 family)
MIGVVSHLFMDTFTKEGVPWLLPIPVKLGVPPVKRLRVTTGKWTETLIALPLLLVIFTAICTMEYGKILAFIQRYIVA